MPLQNRVDPFGDIHAVAARGIFTGNRGVIHDPGTRTLLRRRWSSKAWIICACDFRGRKREVMGRNAPGGGPGWTNLFFLDEVTALAAGHRPCFHCRREAAEEFADCFAKGLGIPRAKAAEMDRRLHGERRASAIAARSFKQTSVERAAFQALPEGAMLFQGDQAFAIRRGRLRAWTFRGWTDEQDPGDRTLHDLWLLTPPSTVAALTAGYRPVWHPGSE